MFKVQSESQSALITDSIYAKEKYLFWIPTSNITANSF